MYSAIYSPSRRRSFSTESTRSFQSTRTTFTGSAFSDNSTIRTFADDPFRARFGHRLPRGLRSEACGMEWSMFMETFCEGPGGLSLLSIATERLRAGRKEYTITLSDRRQPIGERKSQHTIISTGIVGSMSQILAEGGRRVEILEFHQYAIFEATATILYCCHNDTRVWAVGFGSTPDSSIASAMITAANKIYQ